MMRDLISTNLQRRIASPGWRHLRCMKMCVFLRDVSLCLSSSESQSDHCPDPCCPLSLGSLILCYHGIWRISIVEFPGWTEPSQWLKLAQHQAALRQLAVEVAKQTHEASDQKLSLPLL